MTIKLKKILSLSFIGIYLIILLVSLFFKIPSLLLSPLVYVIIIVSILLILCLAETDNYFRLVHKVISGLFLGFIIGRLILIPQSKYNRQKADELIMEIESFTLKNNRNPTIGEVELPKAVNGLLISDFCYFFMDSQNQVYYLSYSNGILDDQVYNSLSKTWFVDD